MPRGRKRDQDARQRILDAAFTLVGASGKGSATINEMSEVAGVAKQTIYRWWPTRTALILDALVDGTLKATPFRESGDIRADFEAHVRSIVRLFNSPTGSVIKELVGHFQSDSTAADEFRHRFWEPRREVSRAQLARGVDQRQIRPDVDPEIVLDTIYAPLWTALLVGHRSLRPADAGKILGVVWPGIESADPD